MKKIYQKPLIEDLEVLGNDMICTSLEKGGNAGTSGVTEGDARFFDGEDLWFDEELGE